MADEPKRNEYLEFIEYIATDKEIKEVFDRFSEKDNSATDKALREALEECNAMHINPVDFALYVVMHDIATYAVNHKIDKLLEIENKGFFSEGGHFEYFLEPLKLIPESFSPQDRRYMQVYIDEALEHIEKQTLSHSASIKRKKSEEIGDKSHAFDKQQYAEKQRMKRSKKIGDQSDELDKKNYAAKKEKKKGFLFQHSTKTSKKATKISTEIDENVPPNTHKRRNKKNSKDLNI